MTEHPIPDGAWSTIVEYMPIPSVDLLVIRDGGLLVGKRENEPLQGEWFVPGGTVLKNERLETAVGRVATDELGIEVTIAERLGTYEHFYDTSDIEGVPSKHYLATAFVVDPGDAPVSPDDQHAEFRFARPPFDELHRYIRRYGDEVADSRFGPI